MRSMLRSEGPNQRPIAAQAWALGALLLSAAPAFGQGIPIIAEPWQFEKQREPLAEPRSVREPLISVPPAETAPPAEAAGVSFTLESLTIEGATVYGSGDFTQFYAGAIGRTVSLADVYAIANAITAKYRNDGYILARAIVPAQRIKGGRVTIRMVEGFIENVIVEGGPEGLRNVARGYGNKITHVRPLRAAMLERYMLLIRDLPGVRADSILRASRDTPGAAELVIRLAYEPLDASVDVNNRGSRFLGRIQVTPMARLNYFYGTGNQTTIRYVRSGMDTGDQPGELNYFELRHKQVIGTEGTTLAFGYSRIRAEPGFTLADFDVRNKGERVTASLSHPLIRSRKRSLYAALDFEVNNAETDFFGSLLAEDRVRTLGAHVSYDFIDRFKGTNLIEVGFATGLDILSSSAGSLASSRDGGEAKFFRLNATVTRVQQLLDNLNMLIALTGQYTEDNMLAPEEFSVGGSAFGRGFDYGEITGDRGFAGKVELQYNGAGGAHFFKRYQLYGFFDFGRTYQVGGAGGAESLISAGAGIRITLLDRLVGFFELAKPLNRPVAARDPDDGKDVRLFFGVVMSN